MPAGIGTIEALSAAPAILFRWLHIAAACVAVGGVFFMRLLVPAGLSQLEPETRRATFLRLRRLFKMVIHTCILLLLVSGIFNTLGNWAAYNQTPAAAQPLWGLHVLLAVSIFAIALYALTGKEPPARHATWMAVNLVLMALAVAAAGSLKYVRDHRPAIRSPETEIPLPPSH
jgi:uncharacterized membrane protein